MTKKAAGKVFGSKQMTREKKKKKETPQRGKGFATEAVGH